MKNAGSSATAALHTPCPRIRIFSLRIGDEVTPSILDGGISTNDSATGWFNNGASLPAGTYRITLAGGAMTYHHTQGWRVDAWNGTVSAPHGFKIKQDGVSTDLRAPGDDIGQSSFSAAQNASLGQSIIVTHAAAGRIGVYLYDSPYNDNSAPTGQSPRFKLEQIVSPQPVIFGPSTADEGENYTLNLNADSAAITSWSIDWGDGTTSTARASATTATHSFVDQGTDTIAATASTAHGSFSTNSLAITVDDAPLTATGTSVTQAVQVGDQQTIATFTDANPNGYEGDYSVSIDWGDGSAPAIGDAFYNDSGGFNVVGSHEYNSAGTYTATVTITDSNGGGTVTPDTTFATATATTTVTVVRNPAEAFVSGPSITDTATGTPFTITAFDDPGKIISSFTVDFGDGSTPVVVTNITPVATSDGSTQYTATVPPHTFASTGTFNVAAAATDEDGPWVFDSSLDTAQTTVVTNPVTIEPITITGNSATFGRRMARLSRAFGPLSANPPMLPILI